MSTNKTYPVPHESSPYVPVYIVSGVSASIFLFGPLLVRRGTHRGIIRWCIMLTTFCLWIFWTIIYIAQINPLVGPRLENTSLAWVGHFWGKNPKEIPD